MYVDEEWTDTIDYKMIICCDEKEKKKVITDMENDGWEYFGDGLENFYIMFKKYTDNHDW